MGRPTEYKMRKKWKAQALDLKYHTLSVFKLTSLMSFIYMQNMLKKMSKHVKIRTVLKSSPTHLIFTPL